MTTLAFTNFVIEVSKGNIGGHSLIRKWGENQDVDTAAEEDVWSSGGTRTWLTVGSTLEAISTSAADTAAGLNAQQITIEGIETTTWAPISETVEMNGVAATAATSQSFIRVNRVFVTRSGTYHIRNAGTITVRLSGAGAFQAEIATAVGQTQQSHFSVGVGLEALWIGGVGSVEQTAGKNASLKFWQYREADDVVAPYSAGERIITTFPRILGIAPFEGSNMRLGTKFIHHTDLWWSAEATANNTYVHVEYTLLLRET